MTLRILLPLSALLLSPANLTSAEKSPYAAVSMKVFADLLKIPLEPPDVSVTVHSTREEEGLIIEDISWDSIDNDRAPAYVIRPAKPPGKLPAVICLHGSSGSRESMVTKQFGVGEWTRYGSKTPHTRLLGWARELSRRGYLTLSLTQRGLDNRMLNTEARDKELLVHGRNVMGTIIYEIRQAITYLARRPDVAADRIGVTGLSFGGITTFYTWLVDDRIAAAAPICGGVGSVQTFIDRGSRGYHGIYWWIPDMLTKGDQGDFAAAMAPRPFMLWAPLEDIGMPKEGVDRFLEVVEPAYRQAGAAKNLVVHRRPGKHTFSLEAFEALSHFLDAQLKTR